jgi:muramoyltetrapeptide carboxypeptidase
MRTSRGEREGSNGFGPVSPDERRQAELFFGDLVRTRRGDVGPPPVGEHHPTNDPVLLPGRVGPAVDGSRNPAHLAIVSPSNALAVNAGVATLVDRFRAAGHRHVAIDFAPNEPSADFRDEARHTFAGTDAQRSAALLSGLFDPGTTAVIASAGGHGATRLLDELKAHVAGLLAQAGPRWWPLRPRPERVFEPKRIVGFSDFTAVLLAAYSLLGWASLHGPMLCCFDQASLDRLVRALTRAPADLDPGNVVDGNLSVVGAAPAEPVRGVLLGGNLSLVEALYGSPFFPSIQGGILFVEDLNESGRKIDRMIEALKQRGAAAQVRAVVVGQVVPVDIDAEATARLFRRSWNVPVVFGLQAGHALPNRALWIGLEYELRFRAGARASLVLRP